MGVMVRRPEAASHVPAGAGAAGNCRPDASSRPAARGHRLAVHLPGDAEVLAEHAPQVAAGEEDRARAVLAAQAILLTEMREMRGDDRLPADRAQAALIGEAVDLAQLRADTA